MVLILEVEAIAKGSRVIDDDGSVSRSDSGACVGTEFTRSIREYCYFSVSRLAKRNPPR